MKLPEVEKLDDPVLHTVVTDITGQEELADAITGVSNTDIWDPLVTGNEVELQRPNLASVSIVWVNDGETELHTAMFEPKYRSEHAATIVEESVRKAIATGPLRTPAAREISKVMNFISPLEPLYALVGYTTMLKNTEHTGVQCYSNRRVADFYRSKRILSRGAFSMYALDKLVQADIPLRSLEGRGTLEQVRDVAARSKILADTFVNYLICSIQPENIRRHVLTIRP